MDNGSWGKTVYEIKPYQILDEGEYFSVWKEHKQKASFKTSLDAMNYVDYLKAFEI